MLPSCVSILWLTVEGPVDNNKLFQVQMEEDDPREFFRCSKPTEPETTESSKFPMNESKV